MDIIVFTSLRTSSELNALSLKLPGVVGSYIKWLSLYLMPLDSISWSPVSVSDKLKYTNTYLSIQHASLEYSSSISYYILEHTCLCSEGLALIVLKEFIKSLNNLYYIVMPIIR